MPSPWPQAGIKGHPGWGEGQCFLRRPGVLPACASRFSRRLRLPAAEPALCRSGRRPLIGSERKYQSQRIRDNQPRGRGSGTEGTWQGGGERAAPRIRGAHGQEHRPGLPLQRGTGQDPGDCSGQSWRGVTKSPHHGGGGSTLLAAPQPPSPPTPTAGAGPAPGSTAHQDPILPLGGSLRAPLGNTRIKESRLLLSRLEMLSRPCSPRAQAPHALPRHRPAGAQQASAP